MPRRRKKTEASTIAEVESTPVIKTEVRQAPAPKEPEPPTPEPEPETTLSDPPSFPNWGLDAMELEKFRKEYVNWLRLWLKSTGRDKNYFVDGLGNVRPK